MAKMTKKSFDMAAGRIDVLEHDKRSRGLVAPAVDGIRNALDTVAMNSAVSQNRARLYMALCDLFAGKLAEAVNVLYQRDDLGLVNVDPQTGRLLVGMPWGSKSHRAWGMRATEADTMRRLMMNKQMIQGHNPLFVYDPDTMRWYLNFRDYKTLAAAIDYCQKSPFNPAGVRLTWIEAVSRRNGTFAQ